jgi:hypothetical protein
MAVLYKYRDLKGVNMEKEFCCEEGKDLIKLERERVLDAIEKIDINTTSQINALGMKILIKEIINLKN